MIGRPDGYASLDEVADAIADYTRHRSRPRDLESLKKNLRVGENGRYYWHWDPRFMGADGPGRDRRSRAAVRVRAPAHDSHAARARPRERHPERRAACASSSPICPNAQLRRRRRRGPHGGGRPQRRVHRGGARLPGARRPMRLIAMRASRRDVAALRGVPRRRRADRRSVRANGEVGSVKLHLARSGARGAGCRCRCCTGRASTAEPGRNLVTLEQLAKEGFHAVALDLPGYGASPRAAAGSAVGSRRVHRRAEDRHPGGAVSLDEREDRAAVRDRHIRRRSRASSRSRRCNSSPTRASSRSSRCRR